MRDKFAFISGSCKNRLGWHIARSLGQAGYSVGVHSRSIEIADSASKELIQVGIPALPFAGDLSNDKQIEAIFQKIKSTWGRLDVCVNCASLWEEKPIDKVTAKDVVDHFEANILSSFLSAKSAGLMMASQDSGGVIINFGDWAECRPYQGYSAYFAVKGAIPTMTRSLAVELAKLNPKVRANCILPGPILFPDYLPQSEMEKAIGGVLLQKKGEPENVVQAVRYLIENNFVTGTCLNVDGGRSLWARDY